MVADRQKCWAFQVCMPRRKLDRVADTFIWYCLPQPLLNHSNKFMKHMPTMHWGLVHQHQLQPCNFLMWTYDRTGESIMLATVFIGVNQFMWEVIYSTVIEWFSQSAKGLIRERGSCNPVVTVCEIGYEWEQSMWFLPSSCQWIHSRKKSVTHPCIDLKRVPCSAERHGWFHGLQSTSPRNLFSKRLTAQWSRVAWPY